MPYRIQKKTDTGLVDIELQATVDSEGNNIAEQFAAIAETYATEEALESGLAGKQDTLTFDAEPAEGSANPVTSGGVYAAVEGLREDVEDGTVTAAAADYATSSGSADTATNATTAATLGSDTVGSGVKPIYLSAGEAVASSSTVGSGTKPVYLSSGTLTASSSTVGSGTKPVYLSGGHRFRHAAGVYRQHGGPGGVHIRGGGDGGDGGLRDKRGICRYGHIGHLRLYGGLCHKRG